MKCVAAVLLLAATCSSVVSYELQLNEVHSDGKVGVFLTSIKRKID